MLAAETRPTEEHTGQNCSMDVGGFQDVLYLAEELLAVDSYWENGGAQDSILGLSPPAFVFINKIHTPKKIVKLIPNCTKL